MEHFYPAKHYVMVDDKLRLLQAIKDVWKDRVTTVLRDRVTTPGTRRASRSTVLPTSASVASAICLTMSGRHSWADEECGSLPKRRGRAG